MELFYVYFIVYDHVHALSATSTHFKWELMLYCLHCPTLNKVFLLLLLLLLRLLSKIAKTELFELLHKPNEFQDIMA